MKTQRKIIILLFCALSLFNASLYAHTGGGDKTKVKSLEEQVAAYIQFPEALKNTRASVIAVSFRVDSNQQITDVQPHSGIKELDTYLIRSLCGKKLNLSGLTQTQSYVVRIRFRSGI